MNYNLLLNDYAAILRYEMSESFNCTTLSPEATGSVTQVILTLSVLSTIPLALPATCKLAQVVTDRMADELSDCRVLARQGYSVAWHPVTSDGLAFFRALQTLAVAEVNAGTIDLAVVFNELTNEVSFDHSDCRGATFHVLNQSDQILDYVDKLCAELRNSDVALCFQASTSVSLA